MIKDIHEFLTEAIQQLEDKKLYPEDFIEFINSMNKSITHALAERMHVSDDDVDVILMLNRKTTTPTNLLVYVTINGVNESAVRKTISQQLDIVVGLYAMQFKDVLTNHKHLVKTTYSGTVPVTEIVYENGDTKIKINYVVKSVNTILSVNNVRNSDITEIMPVLLFFKYGYDYSRVPDYPTEAFVTEMRETLEELKDSKSDLIPEGHHEARYRALFNNVTHDTLAMQKIRAGSRLYKFLVDHFGHELVRISIIANMTRL